MFSKIKRIACVALTSVMVASFAAGNVLALNSNKVGISSVRYDSVTLEDVTGKVDLSAVAIQNFSGSVIDSSSTSVSSLSGSHTLIVTLDEPSVIDSKDEYQTVSDYLSTSAGATALKRISSSQDKFFSALSKAGISYSLVNTYDTVENAVAIKTDISNASTIKNISSVKSVVMSSTYAYPESVTTTEDGATTNPSNVYATGIYDSSKYLDEYDGSGITVAILDTGLDYTHDAFNVMPEEVSMTKDYVAGMMSNGEFDATRLSALKGKKLSVDDVYVNAKVPFAYDYADSEADVYPSYSQHGTHVAGIVAGQADSYTDKDGNIAKDANGNVLSFRGVAPNAQLVICKVFTDDFESKDLGGATTEDILAALEDCVRLNVDIINMSLGTSAGFSSISIDGDTEGQWMNEVYGKIKDAGINLICAASNDYSSGYGSAFGTNLASNPDSGTVGSPSTFDGAMSVASINGQLARYMKVVKSDGDNQPIYYIDSSDANSVPYDFFKEITADGCTPDKDGNYKFKYVVIPGIGQASDYTTTIKNQLNDKSEGKVIAVIKRGTTTFQDKIDLAMRNGADAAIVYNNVAGTVRMSLGDIENPIPTVSVTKDAGDVLTKAGKTGYIIINDKFQSGPFMNDYSSWGSTPDLKLKPDVTAHGGEITSTVSGGYDEMSGTSMASPNLAGFAALVRSYLKQQGYSATQLTTLSNQLIMSTATTVYDEEGLPYSPRKQGSGLATLDNVFSTRAYLFTDENDQYAPEDGRPKLELGEDESKTGKYTLKFYVNNFGAQSLSFNLESIFMTETLSSDGMSVAEAAYILDDIAPEWKVNGQDSNGSFTIAAGQRASITVTLTLSDAEKEYIDQSFKNGMFVEGFIKLVSATEGQCDLNLPFMGFYGDWESAPMLDYDCYEIAEFQKDTSYNDETRPQAQIWATQAYSTYWNEDYTIPMGSYLYIQDENAEQIYVEKDHAAISRYNEFYGADSTSNYMTSVGIKALYAGLLRNAELVMYTLTNAETGEIITENCIYRLNKAYAGGGNAVPSQVLLEFNPDDYGLEGNGKYALDFHFYFKAEDAEDPEKQNDDNTFSMVFYLDYEAPVLVGSAIRYQDYKEGNKTKQRVYLDLEVYDNHYAQSVMLCYLKDGSDVDNPTIQLATEYVTPVLNANKNGTTKVSIDVTDIISDYKNKLYIQVDDYALNHSVYSVSFDLNNSSVLPDDFAISDDSRITVGNNGTKEITIGLNEAYKINLDYVGDASLSNFTWSAVPARYVKVNNGEIFGAAVGKSTLTITGANGKQEKLTVNVVESDIKLATPSISFGTIINASDGIEKAQGAVKVNAGQKFTLEIIPDPWYYPVENLNIKWSSTNEKYATVDQSGHVTTLDEKGTSIIQAVILDGDGNATMYSASVILNVQDPFTVSNMRLTKYHGSGGEVIIPDDKNITEIGEEAFKDNDTITSIIIPKTVNKISERAFVNCTALKEVYFVQKDAMDIPDSDLSLILLSAFEGCTSLEVVDLSNVKTITLDKYVFRNCTSLREVVKMSNIGTMNAGAFSGCSSLLSADLTGLHMSGSSVFANCTSLNSVTTDFYTSLGESMFYGCTALVDVTIKTPSVGAYAFAGCKGLTKVTFESVKANQTFTIGEYAFYGCVRLSEVEFNGNTVTKIGDMAFAGCSALTSFNLDVTDVSLGDLVFNGTPLDLGNVDGDALYSGTTLVLAPKVITSDFAIREGTTEISAYAFSGSTVSGVDTLSIPSTVTVIGEGAFAHSQFKNIILPEGIEVICDYAFYGVESLENIAIPASVTQIGISAFEGCGSLTCITFNSNSKLDEIGDAAFMNCYKLENVVLPDGVSTMGDATFYGCRSLTEVTLPSVNKMGAYTFWGCAWLKKVTFGVNATVTGESTFYPGGSSEGTYASSLEEVVLGEKIKAIGSYAFMYCTNLQSVNLANVTEVGEYAFYNCTALAAVTGMSNLTEIKDFAFSGCSALTELNLDSAINIGNGAFSVSGNITYVSVNIPVVRTIGESAFFGGSETSVYLPSTVTKIGEGAFANSQSLTTITVDTENVNFFSENGVLYRRLTETTYELCAYPSAKSSSVYSIKEGTVKIGGYAFGYLLSYSSGDSVINAVNEVVIPYSVKVIGSGAFYKSGIKTYTFECINAPTLIAEYYDNTINGFNSLYYINFEDEFILHAGLDDVLGIDSSAPSVLTIKYPSNGFGYDNFVFSNYFGTAVVTEELINDETRALKEMIEGFVSAETVNGWNSLEVNAENKSMVTQFSDSVKEAHRLLNNITDATQRTLLGEENIAKLSAIESALKSVKTRFGITVTVVSLKVSADSTHKSNYVEGEKFDMNGLIIIVTYDDYSTEIADASKFTLDSRYDRELSSLDRFVVVSGYGKTVQVAVKVAETEETGGNGGEVQQNGGCGGSIDGVISAAFALILVAVVAVILTNKNRSAKSAAESQYTKNSFGGKEE